MSKQKKFNKLTIVVDMLNGFAKKGPLASPLVNEIIPTIQKILSKNKNILFVNDAHSEIDKEMKQYPIHCLKGTQEAEVVSDLKKFKGFTVEKNTTNSFWDVPATTWLDYDEFEIVGCCTDICILQLALNLKTYFNKMDKETPVIVYSDATATFDAPNHNAKQFHEFALQLMENAGVEIKKWNA